MKRKYNENDDDNDHNRHEDDDEDEDTTMMAQPTITDQSQKERPRWRKGRKMKNIVRVTQNINLCKGEMHFLVHNCARIKKLHVLRVGHCVCVR